MIAKHLLRASLLATALTVGGAVVLSSPVPAHAEAAKKTVSEKVGKPLKEGQELFKQKKYKEALAKADEASAAKSDKSAYETFAIEQLRSGAYRGLGDYANSAKSLEAALATGQVPDAEAVHLQHDVARLYASAPGQQAKFEAATDKYYKMGGTEGDLHELMVQAYFTAKDYANGAKLAQTLLQAQGSHPSQTLLQAVANAQFNLGNKPAFTEAMERLLAYYPSKENWDGALKAVQKIPGFNSNRYDIDVQRLRMKAGLFTAENDYMQIAQVAMSEGLGVEAKAVLEQGNKAGILGKGPGVDRQKRLADLATQQVQDDQRKLPDDEKEAAAQPDGKALVKVGIQYLAAANYPKAIELFQAAQKKAQLKYPDEVKLRLVQAYLASNQKPKALDVLKSLKSTDGTTDLVRLYLISAGVNPFA